MKLWGAIRRANAPGPPEHSIPFRTATTAAVIVALAACLGQHELSTGRAIGAMV